MATTIIGNLTISGSAVTMSLPNLPLGDTNYVSILTYNTQSGEVNYILKSELFSLTGGTSQAIAFWKNTTEIDSYPTVAVSIADGGMAIQGNLRLGKDTYIMPDSTGAFAAGFETSASTSAIAQGYRTKALGVGSHALGDRSIALGQYSLTAGVGTIASGSGQVVVGSYNEHNNVSSSFIVGGGSSDNNRKDVFSVDVASNTSASIKIPCNPAASKLNGHPSNPRTGSLYFNPTLSELWIYTGITWKSASLA
jgi:hypothetical protein